MTDEKAPCEVCGRPTGGCCTTFANPPEKPRANPRAVTALIAAMSMMGATERRETPMPHDYVCTSCGTNPHAEGCSPPRGMRKAGKV